MNKKNGALTLLHDLIDKGAKAGADGADAVFVERVSLSLTQRLGEMEHLERSEGADLGLRVFVGSRQAIVSSSDTSETALEELVDRAVAMARSVPEDSYCGLADPEQLADDFPDLEVCDDAEPDSDMLSERAARAEEAALGVSVEVLRWADAEAVVPSLNERDFSDLARRVNDALGRRVLLVPDGDGVRVVSYD